MSTNREQNYLEHWKDVANSFKNKVKSYTRRFLVTLMPTLQMILLPEGQLHFIIFCYRLLEDFVRHHELLVSYFI